MTAKQSGTFAVGGTVVQALPNTTFKVELDTDESVPEHLQGQTVVCYLTGKMRKYYIKVLPGDRVRVEMTPYDDERGRIVYRER
jgi:translation initiation factor IF-1